jgi:hypothetical protein
LLVNDKIFNYNSITQTLFSSQIIVKKKRKKETVTHGIKMKRKRMSKNHCMKNNYKNEKYEVNKKQSLKLIKRKMMITVRT